MSCGCKTMPGGPNGGSIVEHDRKCKSAIAKVLRGTKVIKSVVPKGKDED